MLQNILFDFDGTLFDTGEGITKSVRYALNKHGLDAPLEELTAFVGPPLSDMFREKYGFTETEAQTLVHEFRERYVPIGLYECRVYDGIPGLLRELRSAGCRLCLATSKPHRLAEKLLDREGLLSLFDAVSGAGDEGADCEKHVVCRRAAELLNAAPEDCILVGDRRYDVAGAHRCGIRCIGVRWGYAEAGELEKAGADYLVDTPEELLRLLMSLKS